MTARRTRLVIGCGYLGARVATRYLEAGDHVYVTTRNPQRAEAFAALGFAPIVCDVTQTDTLADLPQVDSILTAVGYDRHAKVSRRELYQIGLRNILQHIPRPRDRWIHISSTSVFGDHQGDWVDESTECATRQEGGEACWLAEQELTQHPCGEVAIILRLAGIYGPGRIPNLSQLQSASPPPLHLDGYLNLIHVSDAVEVILACDSARLPNLFIVSDGHPVMRRDFYTEVARLAHVAWMPTEAVTDASTLNGSSRARGGDNKRVSPARLFRELQPTLQFPDFRQGLAASMDG